MNANILDSIFCMEKKTKTNTTERSEEKLYKIAKQSAQRQTLSTFPPTDPVLIAVCTVVLCETVQKTA